jgi:long-chain acyl-CoA synthetase
VSTIEQAIKGGQPLLAQVFAYGDRRSYNVALVVVDRDGLAAFLQRLDPPVDPAESSFAELTQRPEALEAVAAAVEAGNKRLSRVEQIKQFLVLDHDWVFGGGGVDPDEQTQAPGDHHPLRRRNRRPLCLSTTRRILP